MSSPADYNNIIVTHYLLLNVKWFVYKVSYDETA